MPCDMRCGMRPIYKQTLLALVLNKVNVTAMKRYDRYGAEYYHGDAGIRSLVN